MARDFSKNTANYMRLGINALSPLMSGAAKISAHVRVKWDTYNSSVAGDDLLVVHREESGLVGMIMIGNSGGNLFRVAWRSTSEAGEAANGTSTMTAGVNYSLGTVGDFSGDRIRVYVNGVQETDAAVTFDASTYTPATPTTRYDAIGFHPDPDVPYSTNRMTDGSISEVAIWTDDIETAGFVALNAGVSPLLIKPSALIFYMPLLGVDSPERDHVGGLSGTITGTIGALDHPVVYRGVQQSLILPAAAAPPATANPAFWWTLMSQGV